MLNFSIVETGSRAFYNPVGAPVVVDTTDDPTSAACKIAAAFAVICTVVLAHFI